MASPSTISEAQLIANRDNAQHSTGPRTAKGKSRTRLNGLRHGLTGQTILLPEDDQIVYHQHCAGLLADLAPAGPFETQIAQSVADDYWRLNRIKAIEDNIFALGIESHAGEFHEDAASDAALAQAQTFLDHANQINLLSIYEGRLNRGLSKKLAELAELQRLRKVARAKTPCPVHGHGPTSGRDLSRDRPGAQNTAIGHGFGFSIDKIDSPNRPSREPPEDFFRN
jgi:hypothetical protein